MGIWDRFKKFIGIKPKKKTKEQILDEEIRKLEEEIGKKKKNKQTTEIVPKEYKEVTSEVDALLREEKAILTKEEEKRNRELRERIREVETRQTVKDTNIPYTPLVRPTYSAPLGYKEVKEIDKEATEKITKPLLMPIEFKGGLDSSEYVRHLKEALIDRGITQDDQVATMILENLDDYKHRFTTEIVLELNGEMYGTFKIPSSTINIVHPEFEKIRGLTFNGGTNGKSPPLIKQISFIRETLVNGYKTGDIIFMPERNFDNDVVVTNIKYYSTFA